MAILLGHTIANRVSEQALASDFQEGSGTVVSIKKGILRLNGQMNWIVEVKTQKGNASVAIPVSSGLRIQLGETVFFEGPYLTIAGEKVINTASGFVFRPEELDPFEDMERLSQLYAEQSEKMAEQGIPNAVSVLLTQTEEQVSEDRRRAQENLRDRRINYLIGMLSVLVGILAIERIPTMVHRPLAWIKRKYREKLDHSRFKTSL